MKKVFYAFAYLLIAGGLLYHFAALKMFNLLVPKDAGAEIAARDAAFGPDPRQRLDVYRPTNAAGPLPIIVFVYGGSWKKGDKSDYGFVGHALAARGYVVAIADYRLMPEHVFPAFAEDAAGAIAWAAREGATFGGDTSRIFAMGHSAGGYNLAQAILDKRFLAAAGCDPSVLRAVALMAAPLDFLPLDSPTTIAAFGKAPDLAQTQPVTFARADAPPFLLMTGTADTTVMPKNSRSLAKKLADAGAVSELKEYEGVSHVGIMLSLAKPFRGSPPALEDALAFFAKHGG
jgi:acetyl esterase/lipase